jgi:hypothetical protein
VGIGTRRFVHKNSHFFENCCFSEQAAHLTGSCHTKFSLVGKQLYFNDFGKHINGGRE